MGYMMIVMDYTVSVCNCGLWGSVWAESRREIAIFGSDVLGLELESGLAVWNR